MFLVMATVASRNIDRAFTLMVENWQGRWPQVIDYKGVEEPDKPEA